jgi:hypothetical protein
VGGPLVHIRAVPEGGPSGAPAVPTNLQHTFYSRYLGGLAPGFDRRQPLPATFAARYVQTVTNTFGTNLKIWREGAQPELTGCAGYRGSNPTAATQTRATAGNSFQPVTEIVRWDEHENVFTYNPGVLICCIAIIIQLPSTSSTTATSATYPPLASPAGDQAGFFYLNLNSGLAQGAPAYSSRASQGWIVSSLSVPGLYEVDFDAAWMGNGCTPAYQSTNANTSALINPAGLVPVCPENSRPEACKYLVPPYIGTNKNP